MNKTYVSAAIIYISILACTASVFATYQLTSNTVTVTVTPEYVILRCDFHVHTTFSDGSYTPTQVVTLYKSLDYDCIAITDHTNIWGWAAGISEAQATGAQADLTVIEGGEITFVWSDGSMQHMLGLFCLPMDSTGKVAAITVEEMFADIHGKGGLGIVAHPALSENRWDVYRNASYIDGWEIVSTASDKIYLLNHDFHHEYQVPALSKSYTLVMAHNRTAAGVREALDAKHIVFYYSGKIVGSPEAVSLYNSLL